MTCSSGLGTKTPTSIAQDVKDVVELGVEVALTIGGGEMLLALQAGFPAHKIVFAGVGKTDAEIRLALRGQEGRSLLLRSTTNGQPSHQEMTFGI